MTLKDYLNSNVDNQKEINDTTSFYDNFHKFSDYYKTLIEDIKDGAKLSMGRGKYNSKICFIFKDEKHMNECLSPLQRIMNVFDIKIWDVMVLFSDKFHNDKDYEIIFNEIVILNPMITYIFDDDNIVKELNNISKDKIILSGKMISVNNISKLVDDNVSKEIFDLFKYLITYNY